MLDQIRDKTLNGKRLDREEGRWLLTDAPLLEVGALANEARLVRHPERVVTFVIDTNPNYTNVCITDCHFCAFYRPTKEHPEAYTLTRPAIAQKIDELLQVGGTRILMQGGHHPDLPLSWYEDLLRWLRVSRTRVR